MQARLGFNASAEYHVITRRERQGTCIRRFCTCTFTQRSLLTGGRSFVRDHSIGMTIKPGLTKTFDVLFRGGAPKKRRYSRLNCEALS